MDSTSMDSIVCVCADNRLLLMTSISSVCSSKSSTRFKLVSHQPLDVNLKSDPWDLVCTRGVDQKHVKDLLCILYIVVFRCTQPDNK